jgi:primosomal replication protein N
MIRYTPAGLPVVLCILEYEGGVVEAGVERLLNLSLDSKALGDMALAIYPLPLNTTAMWTGFLAKKSKAARSLMFHLTSFSETAIATPQFVSE